MLSVIERPGLVEADHDRPELYHLFCCDENTSMCGTDLSETPETSGAGEQECAVCFEMDEHDCPKCGI